MSNKYNGFISCNITWYQVPHTYRYHSNCLKCNTKQTFDSAALVCDAHTVSPLNTMHKCAEPNFTMLYRLSLYRYALLYLAADGCLIEILLPARYAAPEVHSPSYYKCQTKHYAAYLHTNSYYTRAFLACSEKILTFAYMH